ncbi:MAG: hypothetical protein ACPLUL_05940 [Thermanaerothrix sp.]|uniref:hypothetical protein n=1 Tax=Thermanaerothrix sp. TaxID=2972675 RepID=UPI003C7C67F4
MKTETPSLVEIQDGAVGFPKMDYWIELSEIKSYRDLVSWIHHLSGKAWVTNDMIYEFIGAVCGYKGWRIY